MCARPKRSFDNTLMSERKNIFDFAKDDWLAQVAEDPIDPQRPVIDPHHHLWPHPSVRYNIEELARDMAHHNIAKSVFMECGAAWDKQAPQHLQPVGETKFIVERSQEQERQGHKTRMVRLVAYADLTLEADTLDQVLDAHKQAGGEMFRGIRCAGARDPHPENFAFGSDKPADLYKQPAFIEGVRRLGERGLHYETWHYHHQNPLFGEAVKAAPGTTIVLDHFGTPLGVAQYTGKREEIYERWKEDIAQLAKNPNLYAKLGGLAMPDCGFGWHDRAKPPTSDEFVEAQGRYYHHTIRCFGPERCMFESNFPVDRVSLSANIYWNGAKKIAAEYSQGDQDRMLYGTAAQIYGIA